MAPPEVISTTPLRVHQVSPVGDVAQKSAQGDTRERPILFSAPMVRALLDGTKTQTRRVVKPQLDLGWDLDWQHMPPVNGKSRFRRVGPDYPDGTTDDVLCPYGQPGDRLWVRETWRVGEDVGEGWAPGAADGDLHLIFDSDGARDYRSFPDGYEWPRNVKVAHNSEGTDEHWISYGPIPSIFMPRWASRITLAITGVRVERLLDISESDAIAEGVKPLTHPGAVFRPAGSAYSDLWEQINGAGSWAANPWVWVVEFKVVRP